VFTDNILRQSNQISENFQQSPYM